jgi:hypothetical protein
MVFMGHVSGLKFYPKWIPKTSKMIKYCSLQLHYHDWRWLAHDTKGRQCVTNIQTTQVTTWIVNYKFRWHFLKCNVVFFTCLVFELLMFNFHCIGCTRCFPWCAWKHYLQWKGSKCSFWNKNLKQGPLFWITWNKFKVIQGVKNRFMIKGPTGIRMTNITSY